jgi:hypothetical protein
MGRVLFRAWRLLSGVILPIVVLGAVLATTASAATTNATNPASITVGVEKPGPVSFSGEFTHGPMLLLPNCPNQQTDPQNMFNCADLFIKVTDTGSPDPTATAPVTIGLVFKVENFFTVVVYDPDGNQPVQSDTTCTPPDPSTDCSARQFEATAGVTYDARIEPRFFGEMGCTDPMTGMPTFCPTNQQPARFNGTVTFNTVAANVASTTPGHKANGGGQAFDVEFSLNPKQDSEDPAVHRGKVRYRVSTSCSVRGDVTTAEWFDGERRVDITLSNVFVNNKPVEGNFQVRAQDNGEGNNQITPDKFRVLMPANGCAATGGDVNKGNVDYKKANPDT